jgi:hypothetical protein
VLARSALVLANSSAKDCKFEIPIAVVVVQIVLRLEKILMG